MQLGVSNLSWNLEDNQKYLEVAKSSGFDYIESKYGMLTNDGITKAIQSIFYGSEVESLNDPKCLSHIQEVFLACEAVGVEVITFGSPTMRTGSKELMTEFLFEVDSMLQNSNLKFCVEPNAKKYGSEYYNTLAEIVDDLDQFQNITSMIDVGNSLLEKQNCLEEYKTYSKYVSHVHFSAPGLAEIKDFKLYNDFYDELLNSGYSGRITYEFLEPEGIDRIIENFAKNIRPDNLTSAV